MAKSYPGIQYIFFLIYFIFKIINLGGNALRVRSYRGPEKEHFNKTQRCKVTSNQEQYTMHSKQQINWLERDNCRITKNGADYSIHNKKPLNWLERHDCRVTKNFQERNGFKFVRVTGSSGSSDSSTVSSGS